MDVSLILANLRSRKERLRSQVAKGQREIDEIAVTIRHLEREAARMADAGPQEQRQEPPDLYAGCEMPGFAAGESAESRPDVREPEPAASEPRTPLSARRAALMEYLTKHGPSTRGAILNGTGIPAGSLSALLARGGEEGWLRKTTKGEWMLPTM
jgi:hypothetical protein